MELRAWLGRCPLVAILRGIRPEEAEAVGDALETAGIAIVEVPLNSPDPIDSIGRLARRFRDRLLIGAGTVMTPMQVDKISAAGGRLIVTPHAALDVIRAAKAMGMLTAPGFFTATEAFSLLSARADALKLFPAEAAGPAALRALRAVLPSETMLIPVGGIAANNMAPWLAAGAAGFGVGSSIYRRGDTPATVFSKARGLMSGLTR